ncbi:hypothetical protein HDU96_009344 [Phlyctochytrium bullatum]|nr:hypothetical protein HDU96_009344 [Phlyctochytrium bullatum]
MPQGHDLESGFSGRSSAARSFIHSSLADLRRKILCFDFGRLMGPGMEEQKPEKKPGERKRPSRKPKNPAKEWDRRIFSVQQTLFEGAVEVATLAEAAKLLKPSHYDEVVVERAASKLCGYPLCGKPIPERMGKLPEFEIIPCDVSSFRELRSVATAAESMTREQLVKEYVKSLLDRLPRVDGVHIKERETHFVEQMAALSIRETQDPDQLVVHAQPEPAVFEPFGIEGFVGKFGEQTTTEVLPQFASSPPKKSAQEIMPEQKSSGILKKKATASARKVQRKKWVTWKFPLEAPRSNPTEGPTKSTSSAEPGPSAQVSSRAVAAPRSKPTEAPKVSSSSNESGPSLPASSRVDPPPETTTEAMSDSALAELFETAKMAASLSSDPNLWQKSDPKPKPPQQPEPIASPQRPVSRRPIKPPPAKDFNFSEYVDFRKQLRSTMSPEEDDTDSDDEDDTLPEEMEWLQPEEEYPKPTLTLFGKVWTFLDSAVTDETKAYVRTGHPPNPEAIAERLENLGVDFDAAVQRREIFTRKILQAAILLKKAFSISTLLNEELIAATSTLYLRTSNIVLSSAEERIVTIILMRVLRKLIPGLDAEMQPSSRWEELLEGFSIGLLEVDVICRIFE